MITRAEGINHATGKPVPYRRVLSKMTSKRESIGLAGTGVLTGYLHTLILVFLILACKIIYIIDKKYLFNTQENTLEGRSKQE